MATVSLNLDISAGGLKGLVELSSQFNKNMQAGAAASGTVQGGTAGSRAVAGGVTGSTGSTSSYVAAKAENTGYNLQRGVAGSTGSATSDFARQASGLGGLVHVYATFAANMFAVSAAFNALSKAMDTSNLIKGLDQIGAASGRNLGSLAKQMVATTNGAISLQQAMTSTAMASSGGMTNDAILRMTEVAKKASLALGRDMTDSMDRLTKGIVKTQPELLDELGIMTRVIPAQQAYAQQIGKTVASLTDFEKRQAFANAVLAEGEKKFGSINLDTNPYSKILASMQNLAQTGLSLVNTVLAPLVNMLSASPTGLAVAMTAIGTSLLKQAIPAIGMFRENARAMAEEATLIANKRSSAAKDAAFGQLELAKKNAEAMAEAELAAAEHSIVKLDALRKKGSVGKDTKAYEIINKPVQDVSEAELQHLDKLADKYAKNKPIVAQYYRDISASIEETQKHEKDYADAVAEHTKAQQAASGYFTQISQQQRIADKANQEATARRIGSIWAENTQSQGFFKATIQGWKDLAAARKDSTRTVTTDVGTETFDVKGINKFQLVTAGVKETVKSAASGIMTLASSLSNVFMVVGVATAAFGLLDSWMTTSAKESDAFSVSLDTLTSSVDNVARTLDNINSKSLGDFLSVESTQAKANALNDLSGSLTTAVSKFEKLQSAQGGWDRFFDGFWDMFGKGSGDKLAAGISSTVVTAFQAMAEGPAKDKAKAAIQSIVGQKVDLTNFKSFNDAIKDLDKTTIGQKGEQIAKQLAETAREAGNAASALTAFKTSLVDIDKQSTVMSNALMPTDNFSKIGIELGKSAKALGEAIKDPMDRLQALRLLAADTQTLSLLPPNMALDLGKDKKALDDLSESLAKLQREEASTKKIIEEANKQLPSAEPNPNLKVDRFAETSSLDIGANRAKAEKAAADIRLAAIKSEQELKMKDVEGLKEKADTFYQGLAKASFENLSKGLAKALSEAAITSAKGMSDILKQAGGVTGAIDAQLAQQSLQIQIDSINATYANSKNLVALTLEIEQFRLVTEQASIRESVKAHGGSGTEATTTRLMNISSELEANLKARATLASGDKAVVGLKSSTDDASQKALAKLGNLPNELFGKMSQIAGLMAQKGNEQLKERIAQKITGPAEVSTKERETRVSNLTSTTAELDTAIKLEGAYNDILQKKKEANVESLLTEKYAQEAENVNTKVLIAQELLLEYSKKKKLDQNDINIMQEAGLTVVRQQDALAAVSNAKASAFKEKVVQDVQTRIAGESANNKIIQDRLDLERKELSEIFNARLTAQDVELTYLKSIGAITEENYISKKKDLDLSIQENAFLAARSDLAKKYADESKAIQDAKATKLAAYSDQGPVDIRVQEEQRLALDASYKRQITAQNILNDSKKQGIQLTASHSILMTEQADQMSKLVSITQDLATVFGDVGTNLGTALQGLQAFNDNAINGSIAIIAAEEKLATAKAKSASLQDTGDNIDIIKAHNEEVAAQKNLDKVKQSASLKELGSITQIAASSKKMFGEKTAAYKVLDGIEKASAAARMAIQIKDLAFEVGAIGTKIAGTWAEAEAAAAASTAAGAASIPAVLMKFVESMGWPGVAAGAAFVAAVMGSSGGGVSPPPIDQGTLAGTGQQVGADGQTIGTRAGGVLGDSKATAKSLTDSIDGLGKVFFDNMGSNSSNLLKHLKGIQTNTYDTAKALGAAGVMGGSNPFGVSTGSSGGFQTGIGILDNVIGSIFGGGTSTSITGSGITGSGTASGLAMGNQQLQGYTDVHRETSGGWFSSGSSSTSRQFSTLDKSIQKGISGIFQNFNATLLDTAISLGKSKDEIRNILDTTTLSLTVSNAGLSGTEFAAKLGAEVSVQLNAIAEKAYPFLSLYTKVGEESFQVAARLIKDSETVTFGLGLVGKALGDTLDTVGKIAQQQDLIDKFGGTADDFATAIQAYYDALFSDSEKARISDTNVQKQLIALGFSSTRTKDQLKDLISVQDLNTEAGRGTYAALVKLVPAFNAAAEATQKITDATDNLMTQVYDMLDTTGKTSTAFKRAITMKSIDPSLRSLQKYVFALEDLKKLQTNLSTTLKSSIGNMDGFITSLDNFNKSLLLSSQSTLTPGQKYKEAQQQFSDILATATSGAITPEQQKAKDAALGQIQSSATSFLDASRLYNASGDQYSLDFNLVQSAITSTSMDLKAQKTTAQLQLDVMNQQLDGINGTTDAVLSMSDSIQAVADAQMAAQSAYQEYITGVIDSNKAAVDLQLNSIQEGLRIAVQNAKDAQNAQMNAEQRANSIAGQLASAMQTIASLQSQLASAQAAAAAVVPTSSGGGHGSSGNPSYSSSGTSWAGGDTGGYSSNTTAAIGGWRDGVTLVGEHGPEVIDLKTPGRVYNANETAGMFNAHKGNSTNLAMVNELKALRAEIQQFREQQQTETGHLINAAYDAQNQNAQAVTDAVVTTTQSQIWSAKLQASAQIT